MSSTTTAVPVAESTLDESVLTTIARDLKAIGRKIIIVIIPFLGRENELREWDLWGPLLLCLFLALLLGLTADSEQSSAVFAAVFMLVWLGSAVVTINAKFLGASLSFFQTVCLMGYCIAPLCLGALIALFLPQWFIKLPVVTGTFVWSTYASLRFFRGSVRLEREGLVVYPVALFYAFIAWMMVVGI